jgi:hypothetical protein
MTCAPRTIIAEHILKIRIAGDSTQVCDSLDLTENYMLEERNSEEQKKYCAEMRDDTKSRP